MDEHQSMTTVRALAILDIKSSKFHSVKDGYNGLNKVRKWVIHKKILYQNTTSKIENFLFLYTDRFYDCTIYTGYHFMAFSNSFLKCTLS